MAQIRKKCSKCAMSTVTGVVAYVIKNVFSHVRNTDSDMVIAVNSCGLDLMTMLSRVLQFVLFHLLM